MTHSRTQVVSYPEDHSLDLPLGLIFGLFLGVLGGLLFAPKPGKDLQDDVQAFVNHLPDTLENGWDKSKDQYQELAAKTKFKIEDQLEKRSNRKQAVRLAKAKNQEEREAGNFEY